MSRKRFIFSQSTLWVGALLGASLSFGQGLRVMGYNVQNLFDTVDSPDTNDSEFTPNGRQHWTLSVLQDKMRNLGEVIRNESPDVVGLSEVENEQVVEEFVRVGLSGTGLDHFVVADTKDARGIRPALVSRYPIVDVRSHRVSSPKWVDAQGRRKFGRDILEVTLETPAKGKNRYVTVMVNHWLSKGGGPIRDVWRADEARAYMDIVEGILREHPERVVIGLGDFNDTLNGRSLAENLPFKASYADFMKTLKGAALFALDTELSSLPPAERGTHYFHPAHEWNTLDHIFLAAGPDFKAGRTGGYHYVTGSVRVAHHRFVQKGGMPLGCEIFRPKKNAPARSRCLDGASDHFPMVADFEYR